MSERKQLEMEGMFTQTIKPKKVIEDFKTITKIGCIFDATDQGKNSLKLATALAKSLDLSLKVFTADDFNQKILDTKDGIRQKENDMKDFVDTFSKKQEVATEIKSIASKKIQQILDIMEGDIIEEDKLSKLINDKLLEEDFNIFTTGSPLLRTTEEKGYFGFYLRTLLEDHKIKSNFLLVPNVLSKNDNLILGLVNYKQKAGTVETIIKHAMALNPWINNFKLIGLIEDNTINTVARAESQKEEDERSNIPEVRDRLYGKYKENLSGFVISEQIKINMSTDIEIGVITSQVKILLDKYKPKLVLVRNVSKIDDNLDQDAETLARIALTEGYPVLLVWE